VPLEVMAPVDCVPCMALDPDQAPAAVQAVALLDDQLRVEALPGETVLGAALMATPVGGSVTETVADWLALLPPNPAQVRVNTELAPMGPTDCEPLIGLAPDHAPEAVQAVPWLEDQVRTTEPPLVTELGVAEMLTAGICAVTVTVTVWRDVPEGPVQAISYSVVFVNAPVDQLPLVASAPLQPPDAVHSRALLLFQLSVALLPAAIVVAEAVRVTVGTAAVTVMSWV